MMMKIMVMNRIRMVGTKKENNERGYSNWHFLQLNHSIPIIWQNDEDNLVDLT